MSWDSKMFAAGNSSASSLNNGLIGNSAFNRTMADYNPDTDGQLMSRNRYNLIMGACLLWGFLVNAVICVLFGKQIEVLVNDSNGVAAIVIILGYLVLALAGMFVCHKSNNPVISFVGYNMVVLPLGIMLSSILTRYPVMTISYAFGVTTIVTAVMIVASTVKPEFFAKLGHGLFVSLIAAIIAEVVCTFLFPGVLGVFDWVVAIIFCGYIGFDWVRSQNLPPTLDNAVDCACALYVDIINLFIRILEIMGKKR